MGEGGEGVAQTESLMIIDVGRRINSAELGKMERI